MEALGGLGRALKKGKVLERNFKWNVQLMSPAWEWGKTRHIQRTTQRVLIGDLAICERLGTHQKSQTPSCLCVSVYSEERLLATHLVVASKTNVLLKSEDYVFKNSTDDEILRWKWIKTSRQGDNILKERNSSQQFDCLEKAVSC